MTFAEVIHEVESLEFSARVNLASGLPMFLRLASEEQAVTALVRALHQADERSMLLARLVELARLRIDPRYRNPSDVALAVYLWLLGQFDAVLGAVAAQVIAQTPQCLWAFRVAAPILRARRTLSEARDQIVDTVLRVGDVAPSFEQSHNVSETLTLADLVRARARFARLNVLKPQSIESKAA